MSLTVHGIPVIDIDSHYTEPPDLWTSRAPAKYKDAVPHITLNDEGQQRWTVLDDIDFGPPGFTVVRDDGKKEYGTISLDSFENMSKAATEPKA
ncbi:MAG: amidohydrolase, partial [Chloroflexi bacterium]|nr:amidohydrolase [Chloroflexota bacterium]